MSSAPPTWLAARHSGVLMHISSLPSRTGIGNLGPAARRFVDFLAEAGFSHWQVCPVGPTGHGDSPYQSFSAYAGNPYFIDLEELASSGLLEPGDLSPLQALPNSFTDYGGLYERFWDILAAAQRRFSQTPNAYGRSEDFQTFVAENAAWLDPYTTFMALKRRFGHRSWIEWPPEFRDWRNADSLDPEDNSEKARHAFYQYCFDRQWKALKRYANSRGVSLIGDVPIYIALDSADAWSRRELFRIGPEGEMEAVAGVPPDYFSATGQLWGNPLYRWEALEETGYQWWIDRLRAGFTRFDILRLDHFRGFETYWSVPREAIDASKGNWEVGPGLKLFEAIRDALPSAKLIAEDLGYINRQVFELREATGFPGMKIMQFGFGHDDNNVNLPHFFSRNQVVYTGTHDNDTTQGWLESLDGDTRQAVFDYYGDGNGSGLRADSVVRAALASVARLVIIPVQDLLGLDSSARMNRPGTAMGNWQWRLSPDQLETLFSEIAPKYLKLHRRYHRVGDKAQRDFSAPPLQSLNPRPKLGALQPRSTKAV